MAYLSDKSPSPDSSDENADMSPLWTDVDVFFVIWKPAWSEVVSPSDDNVESEGKIESGCSAGADEDKVEESDAEEKVVVGGGMTPGTGDGMLLKVSWTGDATWEEILLVGIRGTCS